MDQSGCWLVWTGMVSSTVVDVILVKVREDTVRHKSFSGEGIHCSQGETKEATFIIVYLLTSCQCWSVFLSDQRRWWTCTKCLFKDCSFICNQIRCQWNHYKYCEWTCFFCISIGLLVHIYLATESCCFPLGPSWCCSVLFYCLSPTQSAWLFLFIHKALQSYFSPNPHFSPKVQSNWGRASGTHSNGG